MNYRPHIMAIVITASALAGCVPTQAPMTFGEVPRDGRGLPVWSVVARKASRPDLIPAAYRPRPATDPQAAGPSAKQS